jgi:ABC-type multidrug transport system permease subunit
MDLRRFAATLSARNKEFLRDRMALSWNILLPVLIVMGFAFAFNSDGRELFKVGVYGEPANRSEFLALDHLQFIPLDDLQSGIPKVERHQLDMLLDLADDRYWINSTSANGYILERLLHASGSTLQRQTVSGSEVRYVDWLIPGVLGMNVMFSSLFGVGFVIVRYRKNGVLKRLKATPLTPLEFLSAQVVSRLWLILLVTSLVYAGTDLLVHFRMEGSYLTLLLVLLLGTLSLISLGLIVAARMSNEEAANGLLNVLSWPMMLLSGVWFSLEGSTEIVQQLAKLLPLTHLIDAARAVMIDGADIWQIRWQLLAMAVTTLICMSIGARLFRWE